jgi:hypothetical protein
MRVRILMLSTTAVSDTERVDSRTKQTRGPHTATAAVAFVVPWFLLAMGSPFYIENWIFPTLVLWLAGLIGGVLLTLGKKPRPIGRGVVAGTLVGSGAFVLLFGLLVLIAPV